MKASDLLKRLNRSPARKAGTILRYERGDPEGSTVTFITLEDRPEKEYTGPGTLCLLLEGELKGKEPGDILYILGIVDIAVECEL